MSDPILSENVTDPVAEERARVAEIDTIAANHAAIRKQAITAGWSPGETELTILRAEKERHELQTLRDSRPCGITGARGTAGPDVNNSDLLASALLLHAGKASLAEKHFGPKAAQAGDDLRARSLIDIFANAITLAGHTVPRTTEKIIAAAFSTFDMPIAVESATQKIALDQYKTTPASWRAFCRIADVKNFKPTALVRPIFAGGFNDVAPGGELHHGNMEEEATSIKAKTGGKLLILDRTSIVNDDLQVLFGAAEALGRDAARWISDLVYTCLLDNLNPAGDPFFSVGAGNLLDGASYAFSKESLAIAVAAMLARVDSKGRNIDLTPKTIVYPVALDEAVREVLNSTLIARDTSDTDSLPMGNAMYQRVTPVAEPRLGNTAFHANASDLHWFLFASPADGPVTVAFLNGQDSPIIEQAQLPPENLGLAWRGYADAGCSLTDGRACLMSLGEAS